MMLSSCGPNRFKVEFKLSADCNTSYRLLHHASSRSQSFMVETTVGVQAGKASKEMPTRYPTVVFVFRSSETRPLLCFYAEKGDQIVISGGLDPLEWNISGNDINDGLTVWRHENTAALRSRDAAAINAAVAKYVKAHTDNPLSAFLLLTEFSRREDEQMFRTLWKSLKKDALPQKLLDALSRADMDGGLPEDGPMVKNITLHVDSGRLTISPAAKRTSLLYFSGFEYDDLRVVDSLRKMAEIAGYPGDSGKYIVANIFIEPDSMAWVRTLRHDTIRGGIRGWVPLSFADENIKPLSIPRTKYFIVTDSKGRPSYRGFDVEKATAEFRKQVNTHHAHQN
ncbi:MAG: hypothetical protein NC328_01090 [Muribaculum sp.]|nr:hypothetical protein [Muribaculum sp.]